MTEALEMQVKSKVNVKVHTIGAPFLLIRIHCDRNHGSRALKGIDIEVPFVMNLLI